MKTIGVALTLMLAMVFTVATSFATGQQTSQPPPQQTTVSTGKFFFDSGEQSSAWADGKNTWTKAMSGSQYDFRAKMGDETNGLNIQSVGGHLSEAEGPEYSGAGGYTKGFVEWGTSFTVPKYNYGNYSNYGGN